jgi:Ni/Co efflux regulator RcnB
MNKTLIALLAAASVFAFGSVQAAEKAADAKPAAAAEAKPAADAAAKPAKKAKHKKAAKKAEEKKADAAAPAAK